MNQTVKYLCIISVSLLLLAGCKNVECSNTNEIFASASPEKAIYKKELVSKIKAIDTSGLYFFFDKYVILNGQEMIYVSIKGKELCATGIVSISKSDKLFDGIRKSRGLGYHGAMLKNLKFSIRGNELVFESSDGIID
ncbi:hypothetical protein [Flavobacterium silvaticum]|uniref:Lipoprotein n=1 Tax=Flavobacterium silvaticum TaxID=1852020 RepID=A0A972JGK1_9FLAO|nr:hypothetical protein [Flavobacterium silvaticum]NMH26955.1 hypothetical protein [Flavobacterium silvaticum]